MSSSDERVTLLSSASISGRQLSRGTLAVLLLLLTAGNVLAVIQGDYALSCGGTSSGSLNSSSSCGGFYFRINAQSQSNPSLKPPQPAISWNHSAHDIVKLAKKAIAQNKNDRDKVGALAPKDCNFSSVFLALAYAEARLSATSGPLTFYANVSPSKELRDASNAVQTLFDNHDVEQSMRRDVFHAKLNAEKNIKASGEWNKLSEEDKSLVDVMISDDNRSGLALSSKKREELTTLQKDLAQTCSEFSKNYNEDKGVMFFTKDELKGVPKDIVSGYNVYTNGSKRLYNVTFKSPDIYPVFRYAENLETRKRAHEANEAHLGVNVPLLEKALVLRRHIAKLLGYASWADYVTEAKMIKNATSVHTFLDDLETKLRPMGLKERNVLLAIKETDYKQRGLPFDGMFYSWDYSYYDRKYTEKVLELNSTLVKEYFPVSVVVPTILGIYQNMLSVRFEEIKGSKTWHPDVQLFAVWHKNATDASGFIGYCYLDLFPRESKYPHAAAWTLISGYNKIDGTRSYSINAIVANLAKPKPGELALIPHDDVVTFFHEMGHVFHSLMSVTKYSRFHGTSVAGDFVEAPSQMLENWCWEPNVLEKMSSHYQTHKPLPPDLIQKIIKSRHINNGLQYLSQVFYAKYDIKLHSSNERIDTTKLWNELGEKVTLLKGGKSLPGQGSFQHIIDGYDAGYYGYLYSQVFAADMYATVFKANPLDPGRGANYVRTILRPGGSRDETDLIKDFLGRPPNNEAFVQAVFGTSATNTTTSAQPTSQPTITSTPLPPASNLGPLDRSDARLLSLSHIVVVVYILLL